ncbi:MAG: response regulator [Flavobacteriales bacterium]|nr:response regulator [Flavobacteriales bacterium]
MKQLHRLLQRQLRKYLPDYSVYPGGLEPLIEAINQSYQHFEANQALVERAMRISSDELSEINRRLRAESERMKAIIESLKEAVMQVSHGEKIVSDADLSRITEILSEEIQKRKLLEADLRKAQHTAEEALEIRKQFLANVSHEIRTPINAIVGMSGLLHESDLSIIQQEHVEAIRSSAEGLMEIINDLLDMSKLESGKLVLEHINFSVPALVHALHRSMWLKAEEKGIQFTTEVASDVHPWVVGDVTRVRQVLLNLLSNAVKFTHEGEVSLRVELQEKSNENQTLLFVVRDSGIGISEKGLQTIFDQFTQEDNSVSRKYGGTGLGLSISLQLSELMGGNLKVESRQGQGSTFSLQLTLPIGVEEKVVKTTSADYDFKGARILIAEDNEINRYLALTLMRRANCRVDSASNGLQVLEKLKKRTFDLILMDLQMPELDGVEATRIIREDMALQVPIVALTANSNDKERELCGVRGMNGYVPKPYTPVKLYEEVSSVLNGKADIPTEAERWMYSLDKLHSLYQGNARHIHKTVDVFIRQTESDIRQMQVMLEKKQFRELKSLAHRMKPNIELFDITSLIEVSAQIEDAADARNVESLSGLLEKLAEVSYAVTAALREEVREGLD